MENHPGAIYTASGLQPCYPFILKPLLPFLRERLHDLIGIGAQSVFSTTRPYQPSMCSLPETRGEEKECGKVVNTGTALSLSTVLIVFLRVPSSLCPDFGIQPGPIGGPGKIYFLYSPWTKPPFIFQDGITREIWKLTAQSINKHGMGTREQNTAAWHRRERQSSITNSKLCFARGIFWLHR